MNGLKGKIGLMASSFTMMSFFMVNPVLADIAKAYPDTSVQAVQMITTLPNLLSLIVALIVGKLTSYFYKRTLIIISKFFFLAGGLFPYFFHQNIVCFLFGAGVIGIGLGIMVTCVAALICDCYSEKESGILLGLQAAFISGGGMVFTWLGGQLGKVHWRNVFLAYLLIAVVLVIEIICLPKGSLDQREMERDGKKEERKHNVPAGVWFYGITGFLFFMFLTIFNTSISMLVNGRGFGGAQEASYASMCYTFTGLVMGCLAGFLIAMLREYTFVLSCVMACIGMLLIYVGGGLGLIFIGSAFCGGAFAIFNPAGNYFAVRQAGVGNQAICIAVYSSASSLGQAISPICIGVAFKALSIPQRFLGGALALALIGVVAVIGIRSWISRR